MTDTKSPADVAREKAEARFKVLEQRRTDAARTMDEVVAAKSAELEKTVRLRALRLAKEEEDRRIAAAAPPPKKPAPRKRG